MIGLGLSIVTRAVTDAGVSSLTAAIRALYANAEQGAWYDPSDLSTLFQDAAGTIPVTAVEQPVGLMLDKSGRGNHASQPTAAARPVLSARVNAFTKTESFSDAVWTKAGVTVAASKIIATAISGAYKGIGQGGIPASGRVTVSFKAKPDGYSVASSVGYGNNGRVAFDLINLTATMYLVPGGVASAALEPDGYVKCTVSFDAVSTGMFAIGPNSAVRDGSEAFAGDGVSGILLKEPQLGAGRYQRVNTVTDYDTAGFPHYINMDAVDDALTTAFPAALGAACTVARSIPGVGAQILTGQTIGTSFTDTVDSCALIILNRALTAGELANVTRYLNNKAGV